MRILMNRERRGKKQVPAPKEIEVYDGDGEKVATIKFGEGTVLINNHNGVKFQSIIIRSDDGHNPKLGSSYYNKWASVGEDQNC